MQDEQMGKLQAQPVKAETGGDAVSEKTSLNTSTPRQHLNFARRGQQGH